MSAFFDFPLPSAFEESNVNTQIKVSGHLLLRESADKQISVSFSVEMWLLRCRRGSC